MSPALRGTLGVLLALAVTASLVALSRAPYATGQGGAALLRLSWSGRPERIERCRELSEEELAKRPVHMRRRLECEGRSARYAVRVKVDGRDASLDTVTGGGLRGDRAIHMLREYRVAPGVRAIAIEVARVEQVEDAEDDAAEDEEGGMTQGPLDRGTREREERRRQRQEALPARLALDTAVTLAPGAVVLVTYDPADRRLVGLGGQRR